MIKIKLIYINKRYKKFMIKTLKMKIKSIHKNIKYKKYKIRSIKIEIRMKLNIIKL